MVLSLVLGLALSVVPAPSQASQQALLDALNRTRAAHGLPVLRVDTRLSRAAQMHAVEMAESGFFAHNSPDGKSPFDRMREVGVRFRYAGENIAMAPSEPQAHDALLESQPHRENMLDPEYHHIGIAVVERGDGELLFVEDFSD